MTSNKLPFQGWSKNQQERVRKEIILTANGDIRNALNQLWLYSLGTEKQVEKSLSQKFSERTISQQQREEDQSRQKDNQFTIFHTIGKFMYNKRLDDQSREPRQFSPEEFAQSDPPFYFDPFKLIVQVNCPKDIFCLFLQENYVEFYGESAIEDVARQAAAFSDYDILEKQNFYLERVRNI